MNIKTIDSALLVKMFKQGAYKLNINKKNVDALNVFPVPDGDTGTNMTLTIQTAVKNISDKDFSTVEEVSKQFSKGLLMGARGNSGVILSQIFRGFADGCKGKEMLSNKDIVEAFVKAKEVSYKAVIKPVEGTILTVIRKISENLSEMEVESLTLDELFHSIILRGNDILNKTPEYLDVLKQAGVVDAGGQGLMLILQGFHDAILGKEAVEAFTENEDHVEFKQASQADIKFQYCTEFIVKTELENHTAFRAQISNLGDSMVFVRDDDLIKVHIHTNEPNLALEHALGIGELQTIKIENMKLQHEHIVNVKEENMEQKEVGFITVAMGDGFESLFKDLNVDKIIKGGQTMNPSTEDFTTAIDEINAEKIIILPNNSNIILAANQAKELSEKEVYVIPTKTLPQGITAMIEYAETSSIGENVEAMMECISEVKTASITYSVRDSIFDDKEIKEGDILGLSEGKIVSVGHSIEDITLETIDKIIEDAEILTIYRGEEVKETEMNELTSKLESKYPDIDIEVYNGKQPLYYYIISVE